MALKYLNLTNIGLNSSVLVSSRKTLYFVIAKIENGVNCVIFMHLCIFFSIYGPHVREKSKNIGEPVQVTSSVRVYMFNL